MRDVPRRTSTFFIPAESRGEVVWRPRADIYHTRGRWLVKLELAGVRSDDVNVYAHGSRLTISGIRRDRFIEKGWSCHAMEIAYSRFERNLDLPFDVEAARIVVESCEGMLLVHMGLEGNRT